RPEARPREGRAGRAIKAEAHPGAIGTDAQVKPIARSEDGGRRPVRQHRPPGSVVTPHGGRGSVVGSARSERSLTCDLLNVDPDAQSLGPIAGDKVAHVFG